MSEESHRGVPSINEDAAQYAADELSIGKIEVMDVLHLYFKALPKREESQRAFSIAMQAFEIAITAGVLSGEVNAHNFAGDWMYIGRDEHGLAFKNIINRKYIHVTGEQMARALDGSQL